MGATSGGRSTDVDSWGNKKVTLVPSVVVVGGGGVANKGLRQQATGGDRWKEGRIEGEQEEPRGLNAPQTTQCFYFIVLSPSFPLFFPPPPFLSFIIEIFIT